MMDVIIMGRKLGRASGWDDLGDYSVMFYDFEPETGISAFPLKYVYFTVDFESGKYSVTLPDGTTAQENDLVPILQGLPNITCK